MVSKEDIDKALGKMILSASGWRGVFAADGGEESKAQIISEAHGVICGAAALVFAEYLGSGADVCIPTVLLGRDTRPTSKVIADFIIPVLIASGCEVRDAGVCASPEIMAWARSVGRYNLSAGFIYVSASHNPIGHNGLKFGLVDGGVLAADDAMTLIQNLKTFLDNDVCAAVIKALISSVSPAQMAKVSANAKDSKMKAFNAYYDFCGGVVFDTNEGEELNSFAADAMEKCLTENSMGIVCDFNGSARSASIDKNFFTNYGFKFKFINDTPGEIAHRIVPEGDALAPCAKFLEDMHSTDASFVMGYVPDCDGDRGNLVIWNEASASNSRGFARALDAQEVFALAVTAELSQLVYSGKLNYDKDGKALTKAAVVVNDATSMRIDRIAASFGVEIFRAEVGEANVVTLARNLREEGYLVRILGEGSAGGNITHPSAVRDPINTIMAAAKFLSIRSMDARPGLFEIWLNRSGQSDKYREDYTLTDIIASLPQFITTPSYSEDACLDIKTQDHVVLKDRYKEIFLKEWEKQRDELEKRFGINSYSVYAYNGTEEKENVFNDVSGTNRYGGSGRGGLKIVFLNKKNNFDTREAAFVWMRGSATEPVFRVMADTEGNDQNTEKFLLNWQRKMIMAADGR